MTKHLMFKKVAAASLAAIVTASGAAQAAQCGNTAAGFESWKGQFAQEARGRVGATAISALMSTHYAQATINADRGQKASIFRSPPSSPSAAARRSPRAAGR